MNELHISFSHPLDMGVLLNKTVNQRCAFPRLRVLCSYDYGCTASMMKNEVSMLSMSDTPIERFAPVFARLNTPVAFLVPTPTGYKKSIMDAIAPVRDLLYDSHVHDFQMQPQGPDNKHVVPAFFVQSNGLIETQASLYRPITKKGDPRIWFYDLKKHCHPCNLLALTVIDEAIYVGSVRPRLTF